jgi:hypothetical protein
VKYPRILGLLGLAVGVALSLVVVHSVRLQAQARERALYVSVVDGSGAPVPNLGPGDFIVREDGVSREVLRVAPADTPMQIAVLVDNSTAATGDIAEIRRALPGFVDALLAPDYPLGHNQVSLIALGERPTILTDYTFDVGVLHDAVNRVWAVSNSGNYLLDGIKEVLDGFKKREAARPVIVAITTEGPELSTWHYESVLQALADSNAAFYVVTLGTPSSETDDQARSRDMVIDRGPELSGGIHDRLLTSMALRGKLQQLAAVLTHEYRVTYGHPDSLIPPEKVTVSARRSDLVARGTLVKEDSQRRP